jgi:diguanylate cyclase (GGDEF)-like protein/PAS domain S-box-containing protein
MEKSALAKKLDDIQTLLEQLQTACKRLPAAERAQMAEHLEKLSNYLVDLPQNASKPDNPANFFEELQRLRSDESHYRSLFENKHTVMLILDPDTGAVVDANPAACAFYGYSRHELLQLNIAQINTFSPDQIKLEMQQARTEQRSFFNFQHRLASGEIRDVEVYSGPIYSAGKQWLFSVVHDNTERHQAERRLHQKTEELDQFFTVALDLLCIADTNGYFIHLNQAWENTLGYPLAELAGSRFLDYVHPEDLEPTLSTIAELSAQHEVINFVNRYRCKDGSYRWIEWRSVPKGTRIYAAARDITQRILTEETFSQLAAIVESSDDAIFSKTMDGHIVSWNAGAEKLYGYTAAEVLGQSVSLLLPPNRQDDLPMLLEKIKNGQRITHYETQRQNKAGQILDVSLTISPIYNQQGQVSRASIIAHDISGSKKAAALLQQEKDLAQKYLDVAGVILVAIGPGQKVLLINKMGCKILGFEDENQILGKNWTENFVPPGYRDLVEGQLQKILTGDEYSVEYFENPILTNTGEERLISWHNILLRNPDGNIQSILASGEDITEQRKAEEELKLANEKLRVWVGILERRNQEATLLRQMGDLLQICGKIDEAYTVLQQFGPHLFPGSFGALCLISNSRRLVEVVAEWGSDLHTERFFGADECWALRRGQVHVVNHESPRLICQHITADFNGDYLDVPMMASGEAMGLLHIACSEQRCFEQGSLEFAHTVAEHLALSFSNLRLRETLHSQSIRDTLTGLFNRRFLEESLEKELHRALRQHTTISLIMLDIDHFKHFNDAYGHEAGDQILREIGLQLQRYTRTEDIACRMGGEEFILILPGAPLEIARQRAEYIREAIKEIKLEYHHEPLGAVSISLGVAVFPEHGANSEQLLQAVDKALYQAKHNGRDRVEIAQSANLVF